MLYIIEPRTQEILKTQNKCWESIPIRVSVPMNVKFIQVFTLDEVKVAIVAMLKGKVFRKAFKGLTELL